VQFPVHFGREHNIDWQFSHVEQGRLNHSVWG
jgi:hypothetical protein